MPDAPATDFRPVILGGDITAYSLVRTFHAAYGVRPLVVNMTDGGPIGLSRLCDHVYVEGFEDADTFVGALENVGREHARPGIPLLLVAAGDWYVRMIIEHKDHLGQWFTIPYIDLDLLDRIVRKDVFYGLLDEVGRALPDDRRRRHVPGPRRGARPAVRVPRRHEAGRQRAAPLRAATPARRRSSSTRPATSWTRRSRRCGRRTTTATSFSRSSSRATTPTCGCSRATPTSAARCASARWATCCSRSTTRWPSATPASSSTPRSTRSSSRPPASSSTSATWASPTSTSSTTAATAP